MIEDNDKMFAVPDVINTLWSGWPRTGRLWQLHGIV